MSTKDALKAFEKSIKKAAKEMQSSRQFLFLFACDKKNVKEVVTAKSANQAMGIFFHNHPECSGNKVRLQMPSGRTRFLNRFAD